MYCKELRGFGNKGEIIQFHRTTELFTYFWNPGRWANSWRWVVSKLWRWVSI
jgi:hypothetical protein